MTNFWVSNPAPFENSTQCTEFTFFCALALLELLFAVLWITPNMIMLDQKDDFGED
jgi:hypothetical protein